MSLKGCRVLVTPTSYAKNDPRLKTELEAQVGEVVYNTTGRPLPSETLLEQIGDFDGYIAGLDEINRQVIAAARRLKVIARYGVGVDNVDLEAARQRGIVVTNTPGANSASVAELTIGLMLALCRQIVAAAVATRAGKWPRLSGVSLEGEVVGLYGLGNIGKEVARRLVGFDCTILAYDNAPDTNFAKTHGVQFVDQTALLARSDFLSLHCPLMDETRGFVDGAFLAKMKPGAYLINTSRGELVDEAALLAALETGHLSGAGLDVFTRQPPDADHPLLRHPAIIATPHIGAHSDSAINRMGWGALENCLAVLCGEEPAYRVV